MRHFNMFSFLIVLISFVVSGCYLSHERPDFVITMEDLGPFIGGDAGPTELDFGRAELDSGPVIVADAGSDAGVPSALTIVFDGTATRSEMRGSQDVVTIGFTLIAHDALEIRAAPYMLEGLTADDRVTGSLGTEYFRDRKIKDADTGRTVMGPTSDTRVFDDSFSMMPGESRHLLVTMDLSNAEDAFGEFYGDSNNHYRVTIGDADGHFFRTSDVRRIATGEFISLEAIENNVRFVGNDINVIDAPVPEFVFETHDLRPSNNLVAGGGVWQEVASFRTNVEFDGLSATIRGDAADVERVAFFDDAGRMIGSGILPAGVDTSSWVGVTAPTPAADGFRYFSEWVMIPNVLPRAATGGTDIGVPVSGDTFRLGVDAVGFVSGPPVGFVENPMGNEFIIRKSLPYITRQSLSTTTLANSPSQDGYKFQASANPAGSVSFHSVPYNAVSNGEFTLSNLGLRKGSSLMDTADYDIVDELGNNLEAGAVSFSTGEVHWIIIVFRNDGQTVSGSGNIYTLFYAASGVDRGDSISFNFYRTGNGSTGYLLNDPAHSSLDMSAWGFPETGPVVEAGFIWSDLSELPHSNLAGIAGGSRDWTDGLYIEDLTQTQTLSR